jgi:hypothetical protein
VLGSNGPSYSKKGCSVHHINRLVLNFPGFETTGAIHQIDRLSAGAEKTSSLWGFKTARGDAKSTPDGTKTVAEFESTGEGWSASTRFVQFSWSDIIEKYENESYPQSLFHNFPKYFSFFLDKSVRKYRETSLRYWGFTIYPILMMVAFAIVSWFTVSALFSLIFPGVELHWLFQAFTAFGLFLVLCKWPGDLAYMNLSVNDWGFARDMVSGSNSEIEKRYETFASQVIREITSSSHDEIIIVGHSFGSVWAVAALANALEKKPKLLRGKRVTFLALGSSLLKIALVRRAKKFRVWVRHVVGLDNLVWHEIQTKTDFISFYKSDPFEPIETFNTAEDIAADVIVHRVNFRKALGKRRLKKMRRSMYLAHRQYILYMDNRVHFDFQLRLFGPFYADQLARDTELTVNHDYLPQASNKE